jgi:ribose transport system substrate-binding protein
MAGAERPARVGGPIGTLVGALLAAVLALALAACDDADEPQQPAPPQQSTAAGSTGGADRPTVALVMKTLTNPFFAEMERGARRAASDLAVELVVRTAAQETSIEQQIAIVDGLIRDRVDAIVIAPGDSGRLIPVLKKAQDAGIAVVNIDNALDGELAASFGLKPIPFVSVDNEEGAFKSARALAAASDGPVEALIVEGIRDAGNAEARRRGARRALEETGRVRIVASETANWKIDEGFAVAKAAFEAHPGIRLVFAANDMMALGVVEYLKQGGHRDVLVAGYDNLEEARRAVRNGDLVATVDQQAAEQGYRGIDYAVRALKGEALPPVTLLDTLLVDRASVGP